MQKGIKIANNSISQQSKPLSEQALLLELKEAHRHLLDLFKEGYPDTQPTISKIHQLENQYFQTFINSPPPSASQHEAVTTKLPPMTERTDDNYYQQFQDPHVYKPKNLKQFKLQANKKLDSCIHCPQNQQVSIVSSSSDVYLAIVRRKQFQNQFHFYISTIEHVPNFLALETHIIDQVTNFKKCLIHMFDNINYHPVFFETFSNNKAHVVIECLAVPSKRVNDFPFYFKQALDGCEGDWGTNKSIIEIRKEKGGLLKQLPRNFRYFYIDFSLGYGYAHIIEDEKNWKRDFALEVLASALGMQKHQVLTTEEYTEQEMNQRIRRFNEMWKDYDWTAM